MPNDGSNISLNGSESNQTDIEYIPNYVKTVSNIFFPSIMVIGVIGNTMVIIVIVKVKDMLNSTNIFLANLAIADIMVLLVWGIEGLVDINSKRGILAISGNMCSGLCFVMETVTNISVITILAISLDRYYAICKPLKVEFICTKNRACIICLLAWPVAATFSCPHLFIRYQTIEFFDEYSQILCKDSTNTFWTKAYYITCASVFYFLPLIFLSALYAVISRHLNVAADPNTNSAAIRHRCHVITILATVIVCFFVCHLPFRVLYLWYILEPTQLIRLIGVEGYINMNVTALIVLFFHSVLNPILYNFLSKRFRDGSKKIFFTIVKKKKLFSKASLDKSPTSETCVT